MPSQTPCYPFPLCFFHTDMSMKQPCDFYVSDPETLLGQCGQLNGRLWGQEGNLQAARLKWDHGQ